MREAEVHLLDTNTSNQIAAGEVVEKPASVVKELVENALDAGANSIDVTIYEGGTEFIRVADNGSGMSEANARLAMRRHATSKITRADDLLQLHTLGFRGEALPSIASVSEFELLTRPEGQDLATSLKINGGTEQECTQTGGPLGTTVIVKDLFFNVPARRKFLKTVSTEGRYINELLTRLALARPDVRFKLTSNDKEVLTTPGLGDLKETITALYGKKVSAELLPVRLENPGLTITGYIGKPTLLKGTRAWQTLLVNGRSINNRMISKAIDHAYQSQIPKSGFPFAVLDIQVDTRAIDVNVHPQKSEVKFSDESQIYKGVFKALSVALEQPLKAVPKPEDSVLSGLTETAAPAGAATGTWSGNLIPEEGAAAPDAGGGSSRAGLGGGLGSTFRQQPPLNRTGQIWKEPAVSVSAAAGKEQVYTLQEARELMQDRNGQTEVTGNQEQVLPLAGTETQVPTVPLNGTAPGTAARTQADAVAMQAAGTNGLIAIWPLGQVDKTFIIAQSETSLYLIDQHAAHERILYDKLVLSHNAIPAQQLLVPLYVDATSQDVDLIEKYHDAFVKLGVDISPAGEESLRIDSLPVDIDAADAEGFIRDISGYLREQKAPEPSELRQNVLHMAACRAAIKAGEILNVRQMRQLILDLCNTTHPFTCPHGRPCMIEITTEELYKMFKRTGFNLPGGGDVFEDE
jgi:DNA mismatch repair protein MutL